MISNRSRFRFSPIIREGDIYYLTPPEQIRFKDYQDNIIHFWSQKDRLDLLAQTYYGDFKLWWIIAEFNDIMYFFDEIEIGRKIIIPRLTTVVSDIL